MGRPSKYTPKLGAEICRRIAEKETVRAICADRHMPSTSTLMTWALGQTVEASADGFPAQYARARELRSELYADEIVEISDTEPDAQKARVRVDARKWVASKLLSKTYGERLDVQSTDLAHIIDEIGVAGDKARDSGDQAGVERAAAALGRIGRGEDAAAVYSEWRRG